MVAGIGFTMAIFIAGLAFSDAPNLAAAKLAVLAASVFVGVLSIAFGRVLLPVAPTGVPAVTVDEAEASTD